MANKEALRLWVADLRRDDIKQGTGYLTQIKDGKRLDCCLGRACQVALENGVIGEPRVEVQTDTRMAPPTLYYYGDSDARYALPLEVMRWLGLSEEDPHLLTGQGDDEETAASLNDTYGWSFEEIADAIERTYDL